MKKRKSIFIALTGALVLSCLAAGCGKDAAQDAASGTADSGESGELEPFSPPISFEAADIDGNPVSSDIFGDSRLTMVNVWATYCNPCLMEMPFLGELAGEYAPEDFQIIGIISDVTEESAEEDLEAAAALIEETKAGTYRHLLLNESLYTSMLTDVTAVPTTLFIDAEGKILGSVIGANDKDTWKEIIDAYLQE